ncbi:MerR family transcriptional regulator [Stagnimonas aquatica]|uniref:MerR family transcriptional regulator n=1 Tax=Stagnimonas aquatica TaxID=2689987 RepID=A0A3N0V121_9GAMM|nr:helix-turn-helix domain-containing protein [Stagnimonas aquatica]ROH86506.1 MerR family transcriptional regulator [Stagnimonas aquatica]
MQELDIGEVARQSGLAASTLRYYEARGLIRALGRRGLRRSFGVEVLEKLSLIALGQAAGFSLAEIAAMFAPDGHLQIDRPKLLARADQVDRSIRRLTALRDGLRHAAVCQAPSHLECPSFRRLMQAAARGAIRSPEPADTKAPLSLPTGARTSRRRRPPPAPA